jgi:hypothetical protein
LFNAKRLNPKINAEFCDVLQQPRVEDFATIPDYPTYIKGHSAVGFAQVA